MGDLTAMNPRPLQTTVVVRNPQGLHARPADLLVQQAGRFDATILLCKEGEQVDCKSILSLLTLGAVQGTELGLSAEGPDAAEAIRAITELFDNGFYEWKEAESE
jgi:phosphocarrier protein HPr